VNKNVNKGELKCQPKAEHEYDSLFSDTVYKSSEWKEDERIVKMTKNENKQCQGHNHEISPAGRQTTEEKNEKRDRI
jgi:hypothetical protein